jgi:hypothetical protein
MVGRRVSRDASLERQGRAWSESVPSGLDARSAQGCERSIDQYRYGRAGDARLIRVFGLERHWANALDRESRSGICGLRMPVSAAAKAATALSGDAYVMRQWPNGQVS